jgi:hypothetical protein
MSAIKYDEKVPYAPFRQRTGDGFLRRERRPRMPFFLSTPLLSLRPTVSDRDFNESRPGPAMNKYTAEFEEAAELKAEAVDLLRRTRAVRQDVGDAYRSATDTRLAAKKLRERASSAREAAQAKRRRRWRKKLIAG